MILCLGLKNIINRNAIWCYHFKSKTLTFFFIKLYSSHSICSIVIRIPKPKIVECKRKINNHGIIQGFNYKMTSQNHFSENYNGKNQTRPNKQTCQFGTRHEHDTKSSGLVFNIRYTNTKVHEHENTRCIQCRVRVFILYTRKYTNVHDICIQLCTNLYVYIYYIYKYIYFYTNIYLFFKKYIYIVYIRVLSCI